MKKKIENRAIIVSQHVYKKESELQPKGSGQNPIL
jgi:hypothetical protein